MNINSISHRILLLLCLWACPLNAIQDNPNSPYTLVTPTDDVWLNVYIHGIISIRPLVTVTNFPRFLTDNVCDSIYAETVHEMRHDPFFYQNQTIQAPGLHPIYPDDLKQGSTAHIMGILSEEITKLNAPAQRKNFYYTYGWSGLLSRSARYHDAQLLLHALEKEVARWRLQGVNPKIRLIGYSHGGTIVLKTALVKNCENIAVSYSIDEAILLGTPIQYDTDYLITDSFFKRVYNFFSRGDRVQKLDLFSSGEFFSDQVFKTHCGFECIPDKLTQVEIKVIRKRGEACRPLCVSDAQEPLIYDGKCCSIKTLRNVSPGHMELWFFGWTPNHYRPSFPLYPLPIALFVPYLVNAIKPYESNFDPATPITITIDVRRDSMIVNNNRKCDTHIYRMPFMGLQNFIKFKDYAISHQPNPVFFNRCIYDEHIENAYRKAWIILKEKKCAERAERKCCGPDCV